MTAARLLVVLVVACGARQPDTAAPTTPACDGFFASAPVTRLLADLSRLSQISSPAWTTYRAEAHALVLVGPDRPAPPTCALVWRGRELERMALAEPVPIPTGVFWYWLGDPAGPDAIPEMRSFVGAMRSAPAQLVHSLHRANATRALLLRVDFEPGPLAGIDLSPYVHSADVLRFLWVVHETFHVHSQFPIWLDQRPAYAWPAWDRQPLRPELVAKCYGGKDAPNARDERAALLDAFAALYRRGDKVAGCAAAAAFLDARAKRFASLRTQTVASGSGPVSCDAAEAIMELEEGVADYISVATALELALVTVDQVTTAFQKPLTEPFYGHGSMQLLILRRLLGRAAMRAVTDRIARSVDHRGGITGELAAAIAVTCPGG